MNDKMNAEIKQLWIAALRSGEYEQGQYQLRYEDSYCCLGVLCELGVKAGVIQPAERVGEGDYEYAQHTSFLPSDVYDWSELVDVRVKGILATNRLTSMNDSQKLSFIEIADFIEENL